MSPLSPLMTAAAAAVVASALATGSVAMVPCGSYSLSSSTTTTSPPAGYGAFATSHTPPSRRRRPVISSSCDRAGAGVWNNAASSRRRRPLLLLRVAGGDEDRCSSARSSSSTASSFRRVSSPGPLFSAPTDAEELSSSLSSSPSSESSVAAIEEEKTAEERAARELIERARALRREASAAEQVLRIEAERKKAARDGDADALVDRLLGPASDAEAASDKTRDALGVLSSPLPSAQTVADALKEWSLSRIKLGELVERLHERETSAMGGPEGYVLRAGDGGVSDGGRGSSSTSFVLGDYDNNSAERKSEEAARIGGLLDRVLEAVEIMDGDAGLGGEAGSGEGRGPSSDRRRAPALRVQVSELRRGRDETLRRRVEGIAARSSSKGKDRDGSIDGLARRSMTDQDGDDDEAQLKRKQQEAAMRRLIELPAWMPLSLAPFAATSPAEVSLEDWKTLRTEVLGSGNGADPSGFVCTSWDSNEVAASFRGRMSYSSRARVDGNRNDSGNDDGAATAAQVFAGLCARLDRHPELRGKVQLFLVDDPEWTPPLSKVQGWETKSAAASVSSSEARDGPPPAIVALAGEVVPEQEDERTTSDRALAGVSSVLTLFTTLTYAFSAFALNPSFFNAVVNESDSSKLSACLPIFWGVLAVSALHEAAHFVAAKRYGVKLGRPVPLPSLQVGTFGNITPLRSFPPNRTALFDVALSGPAISAVASIALLVAGLILTVGAGADAIADFPVIPAAFFKSSFVVGSIASAIAPKILLLPLSQPVPIHPCFFVGLSGIIASAVNLLPIGRLDGGRAYAAAFGKRSAASTSLISLVALAIISFTGSSGVILFWGALVSLTQRLGEIPAVDEVTGIGDVRANSYLALLMFALLTLAPFPGGVGPI